MRHAGGSRVRGSAARPPGSTGVPLPAGKPLRGTPRAGRDRRIEEVLGPRALGGRGSGTRARRGGSRGRLRCCPRDRRGGASRGAAGRGAHDRRARLRDRHRVSGEQPGPPRPDRGERHARERVPARHAGRPSPLPRPEPDRGGARESARRRGGRGEERIADLRRPCARPRPGDLRGPRARHEPSRRDAARDDPRRRDPHPRRGTISSTTRGRSHDAASAAAGLGDDERRVWDTLAGRLLPDAVARRAGMSVPTAVTTLIQLELRGLVASSGGRYERRHRPARPPAEAIGQLTPSIGSLGGCRPRAGGCRSPHEEPCAPPFRLIHTGDIHPGACMPQGLPRTEIDLLAGFEDHLALERRLSPNTVAAYRGDLEQLATFLTRNRASLGRRAVPAPAAIPRAAAHPRVRARHDRAARGCDQDVLPMDGLHRPGRADPSLLLGRPKVVNRLPSVLRPKEAEILAEGPVVGGEGLEHAVGLRDRAALELLYGSGLRVGEVATLPSTASTSPGAASWCSGKDRRSERYLFPSTLQTP